MSELRLAFLGCGAATLTHSRTLMRIAPELLRCYASRFGEKAAGFNHRLQGAGWYNSYGTALADERIDVVLIATPPSTHVRLALAALQSGKHVIVEKPAFLTMAEFDAVELAAQQAGRQVLVAENYYYKPIARRLHQIVADGDIGELRFAFINALKWQRTAGWRSDASLAGGGPLFEGGIHWINLVANLGPELRSLDIAECGSPMTSVVTARFANGATAVLAYSWELRSLLRGLRLSRIYGTHGSIAFESNGLFLFVNGRRRHLAFPELQDLAGYRAMFRDFLAGLRAGRPPEFTLSGARRDVQLLTTSGLATA
ncbi:MAG: Gfo/Idh/MocA family oxidoreductase [Gemmatimonadota bacterium]